ncbi:MAG: hypothetical protein FD188_173 [Ignavibacteria bacterium]|nr:MAG: hypothetical protein FD188_173 [Ignavibacteria bacterium]
MNRHNLVSLFFITILFSFNFVNATTITKTGSKTVVAYITPNQGSPSYGVGLIGHNVGYQYSANYAAAEVARTLYTFDISSIPSNATINSVTLNISFSNWTNSYKTNITLASKINTGYQDQWDEIGGATAVFSDINYSAGGNYSNNSLKNDLLSFVGSSNYYLGAFTSDGESSSNSKATVGLSLTIDYTVPPAQVNITAQNNFLYGTIKVGYGEPATQRSSPFPFTTTVGTAVNLEAQDQSYDNYWRLWNDTEALSNKSKWLKFANGIQTEKSTGVSYSFTAAENDNNSTYEAGMRKLCSLTFSNPGHSIKLSGNNYTSSASSSTVEQDTVTASAEGYYVTDYIEHMFLGGWRNSAGQLISSTIITASQHDTYTPEYRVQPLTPDIFFGTTIGQPIQINWTDNPNTAVTQYRIHRMVYSNGSWGPDEVIGTVGRDVQTFTDYDYNLSTWREGIWLQYGLTSYYTGTGAWSIGGANTYVYGTVGASMQENNLAANKMEKEIPLEFGINNYPNPFNPTTTINYQLPKDGMVTIKVYDILGKEVATLVNEQKSAGYYKVDFDASKMTSGVYIAAIQASSFNKSIKLLLTK